MILPEVGFAAFCGFCVRFCGFEIVRFFVVFGFCGFAVFNTVMNLSSLKDAQ